MPIDVSQGLRQGETKAAEAMKDETDKLQALAADFLEKLLPYERIFLEIQQSQVSYSNYTKQIQSKDTTPDQAANANAELNKLRQSVNQLARQRTLFAEISRLSDEFRASLLELLGKKLVVVMVSPKGKEYIVNNTNVEQIVGYERRQGTVIERFKYMNKKVQQMADESWPRLQEFIRLNALEPNQQLAFLDAAKTTYLNAQYRYQRTEKNPHYNKRGLVIAPGGKYIFFTVNTKGDLAEGYVGLLYSTTIVQKQLFIDLADLEERIYYYLQKHVAQVDNAPGLLIGDLSIGDYEIQVKSAQASSVYFYQARELADRIVKEHWTIERFREYIETSRIEAAKRNCEVDIEEVGLDYAIKQMNSRYVKVIK